MNQKDLLNASQEQAVKHDQGPLLVIAGAGSGKTRVLTFRIAHLIQGGVYPANILAVTFTNKAAKEMKSRVVDRIGLVGQRVWISTFHSLCGQLLRSHAVHLGYGSNFLIFDTTDQQVIIKECLKTLNLDPKKFPPQAILRAISQAKNDLVKSSAFSSTGDFWSSTVSRIYQMYEDKLKASNAMDFDDLIMNTVLLFKDHKEILLQYQNRFRYILVDEYQDTNTAQYELVTLLAKEHRNICVVGDEDQSIYAFRGADIRNILDFEKDYPEAKVVKLEENYRSSKNILAVANAVITNNTERKAKVLYTKNAEGPFVRLFVGQSERDEAHFVASTIADSVGLGKRSYQHHTLLYRTHAQSRTFEEAFMRRGIPYRIVSGLRFYERKEIKDLLGYLRLLENPSDDYAFQRVVNAPKRGIGDVTLARLVEFAASKGQSLYASLTALKEIPNLGRQAFCNLENFHGLMEELRAKRSLSLTQLKDYVLMESGYLTALKAEKTPEAESRLENLTEFSTVTRQFEEAEENPTLGAFLEHVALIADVDNYDRSADVVNFMSLHAAKGLEFPVVFLVGMEDGICPHSRALREPGQLEEERRLVYVGVTRAEEELFLTAAHLRQMYGESQRNPISTFVKEIPPTLLEEVDKRGASSFAPTPKVVPKETSRKKEGAIKQEGTGFSVGDKVLHPKWGQGMVVSCAPSGGDTVLSIAFPEQGIKKVLAGIAPLEKV